EDGSKGMWKPAEDQYSGRIRNGAIDSKTQYIREAAASIIAKYAGFTDLVPPTVVREYQGRTGSVQKFVESADIARNHDHPYDGETDAARAAAFDQLVANTDRHQKNWMLKGDPDNQAESDKIALIDNGLILPTKSDVGQVNNQLTQQARSKGWAVPDMSEAD